MNKLFLLDTYLMSKFTPLAKLPNLIPKEIYEIRPDAQQDPGQQALIEQTNKIFQLLYGFIIPLACYILTAIGVVSGIGILAAMLKSKDPEKKKKYRKQLIGIAVGVVLVMVFPYLIAFLGSKSSDIAGMLKT